MRTSLVNSLGFSLVELLVVIFVMSVVVLSSGRLLAAVTEAFFRHGASTEMRQDAKFASKKIENALEEAGAGLPLHLTVLRCPRPDSVVLLINRRGGVSMLNANLPGAAPQITVDSIELFVGADSMVSYVPPTIDSLYRIAVQTAQNGPPDILILDNSAPVDLRAGGFLCGAVDTVRYYLAGNAIMQNDDTLALNIDSLHVAILNTSLNLVGADHWANRGFFAVRIAGHNGKTGRLRENFHLSDTLRFQN